MPQDSTTSSIDSRLDPFDPLHLTNSDYSTVTLVSQPFDGKNFAAWKKSMKIALMARNKWCFVGGTYTVPATTATEYGRWEQVNSLVFSWILNSLSPDIRKSVIHSDSPRQVWTDLDARFGQPSGAQLFTYEQDLAKVAKGADSISAYFTRIKTIWDELAAADTCTTLEEMKKREENRRLFQFLTGLDESYTSTRGSILMMKPRPSVDDAYKILAQEETQREIKVPVPFSDSAASFHVDQKKPQRSSGDSKPRTDSKKPVYTCTNCKKTGHTVDRCFFLIRFPKDRANSTSSGSSKKVAAHVNDDSSGSSTPPSQSILLFFYFRGRQFCGALLRGGYGLLVDLLVHCSPSLNMQNHLSVLRHAQGMHNLEEAAHSKRSPELLDARLSPLGWEQVRKLRQHVRSTGLLKRIQLVTVSPMFRTMEIAVGVFGGDQVKDGETEIPLMVTDAAEPCQGSVSSLDCPPFVAVELCRERIGVNTCDKRRSVNEYKKLFPAIDFSLIESDDDTWWTPGRRESDEDIAARGISFFNWVTTREEEEIAVVTHSAFPFETLKKFGNDRHQPQKTEMQKLTKGANCAKD